LQVNLSQEIGEILFVIGRHQFGVIAAAIQADVDGVDYISHLHRSCLT
jgi:hypothetical protein